MKIKLDIEEPLFRRVTDFAKRQNRSVEQIIAEFLENIPQEDDLQEKMKMIDKLIGIVELPVDYNEKDDYRAHKKDFASSQIPVLNAGEMLEELHRILP